MNITSIDNLKYNQDTELFNLFEPSFFNLNIREEDLSEYIVTRDEEMRIDLIFKVIYNIEYDMLYNYLKDVDVLLYINNIDNPIDIKEGFIFRYPPIGILDTFRYNSSVENISNDSIRKLAVPNMPNKTTNVDSNRIDFIESNYSLSPVISSEQGDAVRIEEGNFKIGGINS